MNLLVTALVGPQSRRIVDDGSKTDYSELARYWVGTWSNGTEIRWTRQKNQGKRRAHAYVFERVLETDIFVTVDSDTTLEERAIEEGLKPFQSRKVMSVAGIEMGYNANEIAYPASMWYPGNKYVDWIGIDGYVGTGQNFNQVFRYQLRDIRRLTRRPIYLAETGVGDGAHEVAQIRNLFAGI